MVVVSEETGVLSVAMDGAITRYLESQTLYEILVDSLVTEREETDTAQEAKTDES